jgi:arsenate reductase (thioredoxin)
MLELPLHLLVLCTGNSARSLLGEALLNHYAAGRWLADSAGSQPKGTPHPLALLTLQLHGIETSGLRSKNWDEFATPDAPKLDIVITVCDNAAKETCPVWHGAPIRVNWGIPDPAAVSGSETEQRAAFELALQTLEKRVQQMAQLPLANLSPAQLQAELRELAKVY